MRPNKIKYWGRKELERYLLMISYFEKNPERLSDSLVNQETLIEIGRTDIIQKNPWFASDIMGLLYNAGNREESNKLVEVAGGSK